MSTGGGWQDQVGGITPGLKYITSMNGIDQKLNVSHINLSEETKMSLTTDSVSYIQVSGDWQEIFCVMLSDAMWAMSLTAYLRWKKFRKQRH